MVSVALPCGTPEELTEAYQFSPVSRPIPS